MRSTSKDRKDKFGDYMRELYRSSPEKLPSHITVCREAKIDRNFYYRVKHKGFQGGVPDPKNVSALCQAIVSKESSKNPITVQEVLDGLISAGYLPKGSKLEPEKEEQEEAIQTINKTDVIRKDEKEKEEARREFEKMQDIFDILNDIEKNRKNKLSEFFGLLKNKLSKLFGLRKNKSSDDFGSWK